MPDLRLSVLRRLEIEHNGKLLVEPASQKARALLAYVAVTGRPHLRQTLAGLLWTDVKESLARTSLRTALSQLRKAVGDHLLVDKQTISFDRERPHWLDAQIFENACRQLQRAVPTDAAARFSLREAVYLYREGFLADFPETDAALFEEWVLQQREQYCRYVVDALRRLATFALEHNDLQTGIEDAHRLLQLDPLHEEGHQLLIQLYAKSGNFVAALRQYEECVRLLDSELGVCPSQATVALVRSIRDGRRIIETSDQVTIAPVPGDVPVPNNLPTPLTHLVGRLDELARLDELLASSDVRLVSIVGPGGMGKTRLALAAAQHQVEKRSFAHGIFFAELAQLGEPKQIVNIVAEAIGLSLRVGAGDRRLPREQLLDYLRAKEMLLVLDNFEHLLEGAELIAGMLRVAPKIKMLVASRERLRLPGEQVLPILGLDYRMEYKGENQHNVASVPAAARLFIQHAQRIVPGFAASGEEMAQILQICRLVEGMPLGIELAASWMVLLAPHEISLELRRSLDFLEAEQRGIPARHHSIGAVFDGTWQRLELPLRTIFAALSIFRGGFTRIAAQQVTEASLFQLRTLADRSLIQLDRAGNRYTVHEMLRQFGAARLADEALAEAEAYRRHSVYFCAVAQSCGEKLLGRQQMEAIVELEREAENLRVAWQWAISQHAWELVGQAMHGLGLFYEWQGRLEDGAFAFRLVSDSLQEEGGADVHLLLGCALTWRSVFAHAQANTSEADNCLIEALSLLEQVPVKNKVLINAHAFAWLQAGIQAYSRDDNMARTSFARSLSLHRQAGHTWGTARALSGLGQADADSGNYDGAETHYREAIELLRKIGDRRSEAHCLHRLAILLRNAGRIEESVMLARESHRLYQAMRERAGIAWSSQILAECLNFAGMYTEAVDLLRAAETVAVDLGDSSRLANIYQEQAMILGRVGLFQEAHDKGEQAIALARRLDQQLRVATCQHIMAALDLHLGKVAMAEARLQESEKLLRASTRKHEIAIVYAFQAEVAMAQGDFTCARQRVLESLRLSLRYKDTRVFIGLQSLFMMMVEAGRDEDALALYGHLESYGLAEGDLKIAHRQWLDSIVKAMAPERFAAAKARYQDMDRWRLVSQWITELEQMALK